MATVADDTVTLPGAAQPGSLERVGLGYRMATRGGVVLNISRLRESSGELRGEVAVTLEYPPLANGFRPARHLDTFTLNVSSLTARRTAAQHLAELLNEAEVRMVAGTTEPAKTVVLELLARFAAAVLREHRQGRPTEFVGRNPRRDRPPMVLNPLLREGLPTLVFAPGGTGKTTLAAAVAVQVQTGAGILPSFLGQTGPVLVLDWETTSEDWADAIHAICLGAGVEPVDVRYRRMSGSLADHVEQIAEQVTEDAIPLVILDSVEAASGGEGEGFNERANRLFDAIRLIGASWLLLDHVKAEDLDRADGLRKPINGVMKVNRARAMFELRAEKESTRDRVEVVLIDAKRNGRARVDPIGLAMCFSDFDDHGQAHRIHFEPTTIEADDLAAAALTNPQRIARLLRIEAQKPAAIADALGLKDNLVRSILAKGKARGRFIPLPDGRWGIAHA